MMSIVIISFNQAGYLEKAIRYVSVQEYPRLEAFVIDGPTGFRVVNCS